MRKSGAAANLKHLRKSALALDGVSEVDHWDRPAFRTKRRIFITLRPSEGKAMFHIPEDHQEILFDARPDAFEPLHWGKVTRCLVDLTKLTDEEISRLVREAWEYATPAPHTRNRLKKAARVPPRGTTGRN